MRCCITKVRLDWYDKKRLIDLTDYVQSATWDIMACPGHLLMEFDRADRQNRSYVVYTLKIRRKPLYYTTNLIVPCILISLLSVCVFFLPPDALEKMTLCVSILLAMTFFLLLITKILPPTSLTVSLIAKYLLFTFMMNLIAICCTVTIINWNFRMSRSYPMSPMMKTLMLNFLPRIIFMERPNHGYRVGARHSQGLFGNGKNYTDKLVRVDATDVGACGNEKVEMEELKESNDKHSTGEIPRMKTSCTEKKKGIKIIRKVEKKKINFKFLNENDDNFPLKYNLSENKNFKSTKKNISKHTQRHSKHPQSAPDRILHKSTKPPIMEATKSSNNSSKAPRKKRRNSSNGSTNEVPLLQNTLRAVNAIKFVANHLKREQELTEVCKGVCC